MDNAFDSAQPYRTEALADDHSVSEITNSKHKSSDDEGEGELRYGENCMHKTVTDRQTRMAPPPKAYREHHKRDAS